MQNHVINVVRITGDGNRIKEVLEALQKDDEGFGTLDFNKIIPMPEELKMESGSRSHTGLAAYEKYMAAVKADDPEQEKHFLSEHPEIGQKMWKCGKQAFHNMQAYGYPTWYEWRNANWDTKWNAYDERVPIMTNHDCILSFLTAWSPPESITRKLSEMLPETEIVHEWADEDIGRNCGRMVLQNGEVLDYSLPDHGKESVEFAARVWGKTPESFGLRLNEDGTDYEYCDDEDDFSPDTFDPREPSENEQGLKM